MRAIKLWWIVPAVVLAAGCGKSGSANDAALMNDLALASQAQAYTPQMSDTLQSPLAPAPAVVSRQAVARTPVRRTATPVRRSSSASSGTYYPAPAPKPVVKHTKRDAAIAPAAQARRSASGRSRAMMSR